HSIGMIKSEGSAAALEPLAPRADAPDKLLRAHRLSPTPRHRAAFTRRAADEAQHAEHFNHGGDACNGGARNIRPRKEVRSKDTRQSRCKTTRAPTTHKARSAARRSR